ncbi:hypothetical protein D3C86_2143650 [compost metagenome]
MKSPHMAGFMVRGGSVLLVPDPGEMDRAVVTARHAHLFGFADLLEQHLPVFLGLVRLTGDVGPAFQLGAG